ncbi:MAG TPA: bifunctional diaminohydroxyphosphoribosylaminopyrimidine deaminase/5-amino-6-(5-phosphoribosylamino)uracil reductase RibD [Bryobacteraceae bacterium]|jgi:diaminohydroxyphosphoribosylaminopyrimidine deaminase/5-amino-6-(5-phosphoribosylamino)uracil reductase
MSRFMDEALDLAARGIGCTSPNPSVGAVVVRDGEIVGRGFHTWEGVKHAEVLALEEAGEAARGSTIYVTLEPCAHHGRTPPCIDAILSSGLRKVVAPMEDPNPIVAGRGFRRLREAGVEVELDSNAAPRAVEINEAFVHFMRTGRTLVTLKAAMTLDGKIAAPDDDPGHLAGEIPWITSATAREHVQSLRHAHDAILTGIGTVLSDNCRLTDRTGQPRSRPLLRIVLDSLLRLPPDSHMAKSCDRDVLAVTTSAASPERRKRLESMGVRVEVMERKDGRVNIQGVVELLAREKYLSLMIEAGSKVNWSVLESGVADKIFFYYAPKILGGMHSLPVAGGVGRRRRNDAIRVRSVRLHSVATDEFAVEAWLDNPHHHNPLT